MPIQTSYTLTLAPAYEGMVANSEHENVISRQVETAGGIGFGKVAVQGTDDNQIRVSAAGRAFRGITIASHFAGFASGSQGTKDAFDQYETVPVLTKGTIWVLASVAVAVGDPVYYVPATGVLTNVATANTAIPGAIWDSSTTGAALAKIRF
jgi:hypothetical protein